MAKAKQEPVEVKPLPEEFTGPLPAAEPSEVRTSAPAPEPAIATAAGPTRWTITVDGREVRTIQAASEAEAVAKFEDRYGKPDGDCRATKLQE